MEPRRRHPGRPRHHCSRRPQPLVQELARLLNCAPDALRTTVDISELGLTSLAVNELLAWTATQGHLLDLAAVWENPTLDKWIALYDAATPARTEADTTPQSTPQPTTAPTDLQKSYLVGADPTQPWGGVDCLSYSEYELNLEGCTPDEFYEKLCAAVVLVDREPALHTAIPTISTIHYQDRPAPQVSLRYLTTTPTTVEEQLTEVRTAYLRHHFATADGDNWMVSMSVLPDGTVRVHIAMSLICADIVGCGEILTRLDAALRGDDARAYPQSAHHQDTGVQVALRAGSNHPASPTNTAAAAETSSPLPLLPDVPLRDHVATGTPAAITRFTHRFSTKEWTAVSATAQQLGTTPAGLTLAAYDAVLRRWSSRDNFLVTLTTVNAPQPEHVAERTIAVAHRAHCPLDAPWHTIVSTVRDDLRRSMANPISITGELRQALASGTGHTGLSPFIFTYAADRPLLPTTLTTLGHPTLLCSTTPQVLIDCQVVSIDGGVTLSFDVRTDAPRADVATQIFDALIALLGRVQVVKKPHLAASSRVVNTTLQALATTPTIDLLPLCDATRHQRETANSTLPVTHSLSPHNQLLYQPFLDKVKEQPKAIAVLWDPQDQPSDRQQGDPMGYNSRGYLTYQELDCMARRLAATLIPHTTPSQIVGIQLPKGPCQVIATLGVLYTGCTYLPIGLHQPDERLQAIKKSSGMSIIVRRNEMAQLVADELNGNAHHSCTSPIPRPVDPTTLAYIIYTSGSTAPPRGGNPPLQCPQHLPGRQPTQPGGVEG